MTQANKAKEQTKIAEEDEKNKLNNYEDIIDEYTNPEIKALKIVVNSGSDKKVGLPIELSDGDNYAIDWGDGTTEEGTTNHTYPEEDKEYTVTINGVLKNIYSWASGTTRDKIIKIEQWGETELEKINLTYCRNLIEIARPTKNSFINVTSFESAFDNTGITSIPESLFANCPNATNFEGTFSYAGITSIPEGLFANCPNATNFKWTFLRTGIASIPENLFAKCSQAVSFMETFYDTSITSIPEGLFANCPQATNFWRYF